MKNIDLFSIITISIIIADQITKFYITKYFLLHESIPIIPNIFHITYVRNTGAAFGILAGNEAWRHIFFLTIGVITLCLLFFFFIKHQNEKLVLLSTSFIAGGAIGNIIDRLRLGYVVDFLDFFIGKYHWPAFNIADSAITVGGCLLALHFLNFGRE